MMSSHGPNPLSESDLWFFGEVGKNWKWMIALGGVSLLLGVVGLFATITMTLASVILFGVLLLVGGVLQVLHTFKSRGWRSSALHTVIAVLYVAAGIAIFTDPVGASAFLTMILAGVIFVIGLLRFVMALQMRGQGGWAWPLLGGVVAMLLGVLIFAQWPSSALWVIGLFVSIELLIHGTSLLTVAWAARGAQTRAGQTRRSPSETRPTGG